ncbi:MAG: hypothetical protein ABW216_05120 [Candidatus Rokuibacteriota bacterium]|jgi:hypothetical protein
MRDLARRVHSIPLLALLALAACGPTLTKPQQLVHDAYDVCRGQGPTTKLETVSAEGRWSLLGREGEVQKVNTCMGRYTRQVMQPTPPAETAVAKAPTEAIRVPGTWKGMLRLASRSGESVPPSPVTLRLMKDPTGLRWQLATTYNGADAAATGVATVTGDRLRLTGTFRPPTAAGKPAASDGGRPLEVIYMGQVAGDILDVTGLTADQQVHVLSLRRVGD